MYSGIEVEDDDRFKGIYELNRVYASIDNRDLEIKPACRLQTGCLVRQSLIFDKNTDDY